MVRTYTVSCFMKCNTLLNPLKPYGSKTLQGSSSIGESSIDHLNKTSSPNFNSRIELLSAN